MRRFLAVVVGFTLAALAACGSGDSKKAQNGAPVCHQDSECGSGVCDAFRGCVSCRSSSQCQAGERCLGGSCQAAQSCTKDSQCTTGAAFCDTASQTCVACKADGDCSAGSACVDGACQPQSTCSDVNGCRPGTVCDVQHGRCLECLADEDCSEGSSCVDAHCRTSCDAGGGCAAGLLCDTVLDLCLQCVASSDCRPSEHCSAGRCVLDSCVAGTGTCDASGTAVQLCSATGDRVVPLYCDKSASCTGESGKAVCSNWLCTPGMSRCNDQGQLEVCAADGLSVAETKDCGDSQVCQGTQCVDVVCDVGTARCDANNVLHVCSADGTSESAQVCASNQYCDAESKSCPEKVCLPGVVYCMGDKHGLCDAKGSGYESVTACAVTEACVGGNCVTKTCDPQGSFCAADGNVHVCEATGTTGALIQTCENPLEQDGAGGADNNDYFSHCEKQGNTASCVADPCSKGHKYCDSNRLKTCRDDGTGPVDDGTDCGIDVCVNDYESPAHCAKAVCTPSARFCNESGNVSACSADGTSFYDWQICGDGFYCNVADALCEQQQCEPGKAGCNGSVAATCAADGSGWLAGGTDCGATSKICDAGVCKPKVCEPYNYFCGGGNINHCNELGTASTVYETCLASEYCNEDWLNCFPDQCTGGKPVCVDSTHVATCKADGSGPNGAGTACGANKVCDAGTCKDLVCQPETTFCAGGHVQICDSSGLGYGQQTYCFADEFCKTIDSTSATCAKKVCTPGAKGCSGESYGTCDSVGSGYTESPTNCTATGKLCSPSGCATSAVDVIGDQATYAFSSGSNFMGDVLYVRTDRKLTQIELDSFSDLSGQSLHWAVYSSLTEGGPYAPVFDSFAPGTTAGFQSSGAISVTLSSGRYYVIGMRAQSGLFIYRNDGLTAPLSFANPLGTLAQYADPGMLPATFSASTQSGSWHVRLTTVLP